MRSSNFTENNKIITFLREVEAGATAVEVCCWYGISEQTFYRWRSKLGGLEPSDANRQK